MTTGSGRRPRRLRSADTLRIQRRSPGARCEWTRRAHAWTFLRQEPAYREMGWRVHRHAGQTPWSARQAAATIDDMTALLESPYVAPRSREHRLGAGRDPAHTLYRQAA